MPFVAIFRLLDRVCRRSGTDFLTAGKDDRSDRPGGCREFVFARHKAAGSVSWAAEHMDLNVFDADNLAGPNLAGFAQLDGAVDGYRAARDQGLAGTAAVAQAGQFQQLVEFDELAIEVEFNMFH